MAKDLFEQALKAEGIVGQLADVARSIYQQESGSGKNTKTSNAGAHGGMQIIPSTFRSVADKGWDINDPMQNARAGIRYLSQLDKQSGGDPALTAVGYYGGPGAMAKAKKGIAVSDPRNPKAPNTLQYAEQVVGRMPKQQSVLAMPDDQVPSAPPVQLSNMQIAQAAPVAVMPQEALQQPVAAMNTAGMAPSVDEQVPMAPVASQGDQWAALKNAMAAQSMQPADLSFGGRKVAPQQLAQMDMGETDGVGPIEILRKFGMGVYAQDPGRYQTSVPEFARTDEYTG